MHFDKLVSDLSWKIADQSDNQKILDLYNSLSMEGGVFSIRFVKDPDYFKFCNYEGPNHHVAIAVNSDNVAEGLMTFNVRPSYLNGKKAYVCHISDLRVSRKKDRKAAWSWVDLGNAFISGSREVDEMKGCNHVLGSYVGDNKYAIKALRDTSPWGISVIANYDMVSIIGQTTVRYDGEASSLKSGVRVAVFNATPRDIPELKKYLDRQNRERVFGYIYEGEDDELERRFRVWDGFSISSFYIARDPSGEILGCCATWNPSKGRRIIVDKFPEDLQQAARALNLFGENMPREGSELEILYITNLELNHKLTTEQKRHVFGELIDAIYKSGIVNQYHALSFCDYHKETLSPGIEAYYVFQKNSTVLYQLHAKERTVDIVKEEELSHPPGHEMVLT